MGDKETPSGTPELVLRVFWGVSTPGFKELKWSTLLKFQKCVWNCLLDRKALLDFPSVFG